MSTKHDLKTWPQYFQAIWDDIKPFEIRKNDRGFEVGDTLVLREYDPHKQSYSGRVVFAIVLYLTDWGQPKGQVVMSFEEMCRAEGLTP